MIALFFKMHKVSTYIHGEDDRQICLKMEKGSQKKFEPNLREKNTVEKW